MKVASKKKPFDQIDEDEITFMSSSLQSSIAVGDSDIRWYEDLKKQTRKAGAPVNNPNKV
jgi:hypothetical protein